MSKHIQIGAFRLDPIKSSHNQPTYEVWYGHEYLGFLMQSPKTKKWAITHNAYINPESRDEADRYCWEKPSSAIYAHNRHLNIIFDAKCLDILPKTPEVERQQNIDRERAKAKLRATINDPTRSEGAKNAAQVRLAQMEEM